jgi:hypothetical protein
MTDQETYRAKLNTWERLFKVKEEGICHVSPIPNKTKLYCYVNICDIEKVEGSKQQS